MSTKPTINKLTIKQENFAQAYVKLGDASKAYREAYSCGKTKDTVIHVKACEILKNGKVAVRVAELQAISKEISEKEFKHTIYDSLKLDLEMVERYKRHIAILENPESTAKEIEVAKRTIQFIGVAGFNAAQDRISKKQGFYEKDNNQKSTTVILEDENSVKDRVAALMAKMNK
jgi:phage terminase small subunit